MLMLLGKELRVVRVSALWAQDTGEVAVVGRRERGGRRREGEMRVVAGAGGVTLMRRTALNTG
jgi:hypothetical protein